MEALGAEYRLDRNLAHVPRQAPFGFFCLIGNMDCMRWRPMRTLWNALVVIGALAGCFGSADAEVTLRVVPYSDLKILDPIWTPAYITRNHGYLIYDTLFAMDEQGEVRPQMVDRYEVSADKLTYTFTLRDGLLWHDGAPVTAEDCIASTKRWAAKDIVGAKILSLADTLTALDSRTFAIRLKEPTGLLIFAL